MTVKQLLTYGELIKAIEVAFCDDKDIFSLYDPNVKVSSVKDIVDNISHKILSHSDVIVKGVYHKNELIGYVAHNRKALISFSISVKYRVRKFLREFFSLIKKEIGGEFVCFLWNRNQRAIKWLKKNGMQVTNMTAEVTRLVYK